MGTKIVPNKNCDGNGSESEHSPVVRKSETRKMKPRKKHGRKATHDSWWRGC